LGINNQFKIEEVKNLYKDKNNFKIIKGMGKTKKCFIYFSGNGIYYPNNKDEVFNTLVKSDRYEWEKNLCQEAELIILVRDVYKQWYVDGINVEINSVDKLAFFLSIQTKGYEIICVGNSAGGYIAMIIGILLNASKVYSFCGQFSLVKYLFIKEFRELNELIVKNENILEKKRYYDLVKYIELSKIEIYHFFAGNNTDDSEQVKLVESLNKIRLFAFNAEIHGQTCYPINFIPLFSMPEERLRILSESCKGRILKPFLFSLKVSGIFKTLQYLLISRIINKIR
jgi:hypothetical protein